MAMFSVRAVVVDLVDAMNETEAVLKFRRLLAMSGFRVAEGEPMGASLSEEQRTCVYCDRVRLPGRDTCGEHRP